MTALQGLKWINRHGTACALLVLLLAACFCAHAVAMGTITLLSDLALPSWPPRFLRNMAGIQFINANTWLALPHLLWCFGLLISLEIRGTPRSVVWSVFIILGLPICGYLLTCIRVGFCSVTFMGGIHGG